MLEDAGYTNLVAAAIDDPYSYVFDGQWGYLDYALGSAAAVEEVTGVGEWHINADEPAVLDYNTEFKSAGQVASLYAPDQFRISDHDPILVGLDPVNDPPSVDAGGPYTVVEGGSVSVSATGQDPEGTAVSFAWDLDGLPGFEASGQQVSFSAAGLNAPLTRTIRVRATDAFGNQAVDEATVKVIWSFAFRRPLLPPPAVNPWIAGLPVLVPFTLSGNQGLGVLDGTPTIHADGLRDPRPDRSTDRHLDDRPRALLRASDGYVRVHLEDDALPGQDMRDAEHRPR